MAGGRLAAREGLLVARRGLPAVVQRVVEEMAGARHEAFSTRLEGALQRRRISRQRIGGGKRLGEKRYRESLLRRMLPVAVRILLRDATSEVEHRRPPCQITLHHPMVERVFGPRRIGKAFVTGLRL